MNGWYVGLLVTLALLFLLGIAAILLGVQMDKAWSEPWDDGELPPIDRDHDEAGA